MDTLSSQEFSQAYSLRNLYFTRTAVQLLWAGLILTTAVSRPSVAAGLLVLYPVWDVVCTVFDLKTFTSSSRGQSIARYLNIAFGVLAAVGVALTVFHSPEQAVVVFGAWALAAGLTQLAVGLARRGVLGGQWAMILSGLQSAIAGVAFIAGALNNSRHIKDVGGYAILGGIYFLIAGVLLQRKLSRRPGVAKYLPI